MIVAHLSDLHLGYRAQGRRDAPGDPRERDVARAFRAAVRELLRIRPSVVLISGDVFDRSDPPSEAVVVLARGLETLRSALPETPVLMVAGARDSPGRAGDPSMLAAFDTLPNVEIATGTARSVHVGRLGLHALLLPHRATLERPAPEIAADPEFRWNVLLAYGRPSTDGVGSADETTVDPSAWDYVGLGSSHGFRRLAPRVATPGSLERVGPEPWSEAHGKKGFAVADLAGGDVELREVPGRPVVSLAPIRWDPGRPERVNERIRELGREVPGGIDGKVVRLRLEGMGPGELLRLDPELLSELRRRTVHLAVDVVPPPGRADEAPDLRARVRRHLRAEGAEREVLDDAVAALLDDDPPGGLEP